MKAPLKPLTLTLIVVAVYLVLPIATGIAAAVVLHGDNSLSDPELAHWITVVVGLLPGLLLPWFIKMKLRKKLVCFVLAVPVLCFILFMAGVTTACGVYGACL